MAPENLLTQLKDIHYPQAIGWWPIAWGWILILGFITLGIVGFIIYRCYLARAKVTRDALQILAAIRTSYQNHQNGRQHCVELSALLRRVALAYYPREQVAGLKGEHWLRFLNQTSQGFNFNDERQALLNQPYTSTCFDDDLIPLFAKAENWIKGLPKHKWD